MAFHPLSIPSPTKGHDPRLHSNNRVESTAGRSVIDIDSITLEMVGFINWKASDL